MNYDENQDLTIFSALHEAVTAKDKRQLKFAKCNNCGRLTPYRLRLLKDGSLICKKCETPILLSNTK
jgi:formylmethanofuran dehydrogenase subunit E